MKWCSQVTKLTVRTNADNPEQTANALAFGAVGIGLCRTEHMFFEGDRIDAMREMILADTLEDRQKALARRFCRTSGKISPACSRSSKACPRRFASSIRPCTNSCRTTSKQQHELAQEDAHQA